LWQISPETLDKVASFIQYFDMQLSNTNWNLYKTFIVVYEAKNLHTASKILGITRSGVSHNLKELGNQLGFKLFEPHSKGVEPTTQATNIYPTIKTAVDAITAAENISQRQDNIIKMAVSNSYAEIVLQAFFKEFYQKHPDMRLEISKLENLTVIQRKQLDFIIDYKDYIDTQVFKIIDLFKVTGAFVATKDYLTRKSLSHTMTKNELFNQPIILRKEAWQEFAKYSQIKDTPQLIQSNSTDMTYSMVKDSIGIGYLTKSLIKASDNKNIVEIKINDIDFPTVWYSCGYINLSETAKIFIDELIVFAQKNFS